MAFMSLPAVIKLSVVASDIFGVSGRAMMAALIAGERYPEFLGAPQLARVVAHGHATTMLRCASIESRRWW